MKLTSQSKPVRWLVLPLMLLLLAGCNSKPAPGETATESKARPKQEAAAPKESEQKAPTLSQGYQDPKTGLVVKSPHGWQAAPYEGAVVALLSPAANEDDIFQENVLITHDDQFKNLNMAAYLKALAYDVRQRYPDTQTLESGEIEIAGTMAHWLVDSFTGPKGPTKVYRVVVIKAPSAYVLHGTAPAATFDRYRPTFEAIAASMAWPKPEGAK